MADNLTWYAELWLYHFDRIYSCNHTRKTVMRYFYTDLHLNLTFISRSISNFPLNDASFRHIISRYICRHAQYVLYSLIRTQPFSFDWQYLAEWMLDYLRNAVVSITSLEIYMRYSCFRIAGNIAKWTFICYIPK